MTLTWDPIPTLAMAQELYLSQPRGLGSDLSSAVGGHVFVFFFYLFFFNPWPLCLLPGLPGWVLDLVQHSPGFGLALDDSWLPVCPFSSALYVHNLKPIITKTISTTSIKAKCSLPASLRAPAGEEVGLRKSSQKVSCQRLLKMSAAQR